MNKNFTLDVRVEASLERRVTFDLLSFMIINLLLETTIRQLNEQKKINKLMLLKVIFLFIAKLLCNN